MLQSRHRRIRSTLQTSASPTSTTAIPSQHQSAVVESGNIEWSKTNSRACTRLIPSLRQIFSRGESFTGVAADAYGLLLSNDSAFIFPYASTSSIPPILTFPLPQGEETLLGALVPGPSTEPGLLVCMPTSGRIGYWPALHSALAPSSGIESKLTLSGGEHVTHLCNAGAAGLVLSTSSGRLVHISLRDAAGKAIVVLTNMSGSSGWFGSIISAAVRKEIVSIKAGAAQSREERQIHVVTKRGGLTIWEIARGGNYRSILDCDLAPLLQGEAVSALLDVVAYPVEANSVLLLARTGSGMVKVLGVRFDAQAQPEIFHRSTLPVMEDPRIHLPNPGHVAFVSTRSGVYLITLSDGHIELIELKEDVEIVAVGIEDQMKNRRNPGLVLLTNGAGVLRIEVFPTPTSRTDAIKSRLEQAVFYGTKDDNPITFMPPPSNCDMQTRELSLEVVNGRSPFVQKSVGLGDALRARVKALDDLTDYVQETVKHTTLQVLRQNIEKTVAGEALWSSVDARVEGTSIITQLIPIAARTATSKTDQDPVRSFFLSGLDKVGEVVVSAHRACIEAAAVLETQPLSAIVLESNELILAILMSATKYRDEHTKYGSGGDKWTSASEIIQSVTVQFDICTRLITSMGVSEGDALRDQLVGLTATNCRLYEDALASIQTTTETTKTEHKVMHQKYAKLRAMWLRSLVGVGRADRALEIGEQFKDFQSLVEICHEEGEKAHDEEAIGNVIRRLEWYLHTFGYDFATALWEHYIKHRQYWNLLREFPAHREYLTSFFADGRYPSISWMNDVIIGDFDKAGKTLLSIPETRVEKRKIQLSIARLALLVNNETVEKEVEDQIRTSVIMDRLLSEVRAVSTDAIDSTAALELACGSLTPRSVAGPERSGLLRRHISKLNQSQILTLGEATDYLTSKRNPDFFSALELLECASVPDAVRSFHEKLIWRRCFMSDDWSKIVDTRGRSDTTVEAATEQTHLFQTIRKSLDRPDPTIRLLEPKEAYFVDQQVIPFTGLSPSQLSSLKSEYQRENESLDRLEAHADLSNWHKATIQAAQTSLTRDPDDEYVNVEHEHTGQSEREGDGDDVFMEE